MYASSSKFVLPHGVSGEFPVLGQGLHLADGGKLFASSHRALLPPVSVRGPDLKREEEIEEDCREEEDRPEVKAEKSKKDEKGAKEDEQLRWCLGKS